MTVIPYKISIPGRLADEFARGFKSISVERLAHGRPIAIFLWHADSEGLKVQSVMHDVAERFEVGALEFSRITGTVSEVSEFDLPGEFGVGLKASKLVLSTDGVTVESGIVLQGNRGNEMVLVAGAQPYTIAIKAPSVVEEFDPEYPLSKYSREPID
jgi:hypothetical protein